MIKKAFYFYLLFLMPFILQAQWFRQTTPEWSERFESVYFVDSLTGYLAGENIYKTIDGGKNWTKIHDSMGHNAGQGIFFMNADTGWVTSKYHTIRTIYESALKRVQ